MSDMTFAMHIYLLHPCSCVVAFLWKRHSIMIIALIIPSSPGRPGKSLFSVSPYPMGEEDRELSGLRSPVVCLDCLSREAFRCFRFAIN